jgi:hypothetical protein
MHRTQIYFEETLFEAIRKEANTMGVTLSAYIRDILFGSDALASPYFLMA